MDGHYQEQHREGHQLRRLSRQSRLDPASSPTCRLPRLTGQTQSSRNQVKTKSQAVFVAELANGLS